ncbi:flippase-like domain-containing protein [Desulfonema ishimotonii]|nr:flippase-like domain-containing protein [Desulfonema ishimotonii]
MRKSFVKFILSMIVSIGLLCYTLNYFDIEKTAGFIQGARPDYLILSFFIIVVAYLIRGYRWIIWEKELSYRESFKLIMIGFMGNNILPARLGEFLRAYCTGRKTGANYGGTAALASIAIERVLDGLVIAIIGILGLVFIPVSAVLFNSLLFVSLGFGILTAGLISSIFFHEKIRRGLGTIHRIFPGHLTRFGMEKTNYFLDGLLLLKTLPQFANSLFFTTVIWGVELFAYYLISNAVHEGVTFSTCHIFLAVVNFASLFPLTIGGIGAIEGVATVFLISAGIPHEQALAMVVIQHAFQFGFTTLGGGILYFSGGYYSLPSDSQGKADRSRPAPESTVLREASDLLKDLSAELCIDPPCENRIELSIVIPAYNEQNRLPKTLLQTIAWCSQNGLAYEIIVSDDGSRDDTLELAKLFASQVSQVEYIACPHMGKGAAIRMGMLNAKGAYVLFMDADGATPLNEIPGLMAALAGENEIAIGSRVVQNPDETSVITATHRRVLGRVFSGMVNAFVISGIADTQCGFKMFRRSVIRDIFSRQKLNGFAFDVEILYLARKLGFSVKEIPVNWVNQEGSKVNLVADSVKMFFDILKIHWLHKNRWDDPLP